MESIAGLPANNKVTGKATIVALPEAIDRMIIDEVDTLTQGDNKFWSSPDHDRSEYLHSFFQYPAMMVPVVQRRLIEIITRNKPSITNVLDPYMGSGTSLVACMENGLNCYGQDINPLAILVSKTRTGPYYIKAIKTRKLEFFERFENDTSNRVEVTFRGLKKWFKDSVSIELSKIVRAIRQEERPAIRRFYWVVLAEVVRLTSNDRTSTFKLHIREAEEIEGRTLSPIEQFKEHFESCIEDLNWYSNLLMKGNKLSKGAYIGKVSFKLLDSKESVYTPTAVNNFFDLLVTSPPYGDNKTTVTYGQHSYLPLQWIDLSDIDELATADYIKTTSEIDSRGLGGRLRQLSSDQLAVLFKNSPSFERTYDLLKDKSLDKLKKVVSFINDLYLSIVNIHACLKVNSYQIWTVGNRNVGGMEIPNDKIIKELIENQGAVLIKKISRKILNKRMAIRNKDAELMSFEDILILGKLAKATRSPHFDVSAALIRQLGEELVSDEVTAMMELIKNSYDADADWVNVEINTQEYYSDHNSFYKDSPRGYIVITDDGFGMSDDDIWNSWMKISLSSKKKFKAEGKVTEKGRTPLGEKGVGRLSTNKLGSRLELFTGKVKSDLKNHVAFDWDTFDDDTSLTSVPVHIGQFQKSNAEKGTKLVITNLKDPQKWNGTSWDKFRGQISQMIFPFKEKRVFNVYLKHNGESIDLDELSQNVRKNAVATVKFDLTDWKVEIKGIVKLQKLNGSNSQDAIDFYETKILPDFGKDFFYFLTDATGNKKNYVDNLVYSGNKGVFYTFKRKIDFPSLDKLSFEIEDLNTETPVAYPGDFTGEIDDFYFKDSDSITQAFSTIAEFKRIVQNQVGIRIFRDGFGIKPYGIDGQDWLTLSGGQTSGGSFYGLRPGNVVGYVSITAKENKNLKEKTDREGFTDTPYSRNFMRVMNYVIDQINDIFEGTRRSYNDYKKHQGQEAAGIQNISDSFAKLNKASAKSKSIGKKTQDVKRHLANMAVRVKEAGKRDGNRTQEGQDRTSLFLEISNLFEEAQLLLSQVEEILEETNKLEEHVRFLQPKIESLEEQLSDFAELAGLGLTAEALSHELSNIVDRVVEETDRLNKKLKGKTTIDLNIVSVYVEYIRSATKSFRKQLSHLAPSLKYVRESKESISAKEFISELKDYYADRFKSEIAFETSMKGADFYIKTNKGKLTQILDNIILNSEYWLKEKVKQHPRFKPVVTVECKEPYIRVFDNGNGIAQGIQDRIFQPFVSAKPKKVGRGLGLFIVQQLLESISCEIMLSNEKNQYGSRYIFQIDLSPVIE